MSELNAKEYKRFEDIRHVRDNSNEYWFARELALVLDYTQWRNFTKVIDKAMIASKNSGHDVVHDFAEVSKIVKAGATLKPIIQSGARYAPQLSVSAALCRNICRHRKRASHRLKKSNL